MTTTVYDLMMDAVEAGADLCLVIPQPDEGPTSARFLMPLPAPENASEATP